MCIYIYIWKFAKILVPSYEYPVHLCAPCARPCAPWPARPCAPLACTPLCAPLVRPLALTMTYFALTGAYRQAFRSI